MPHRSSQQEEQLRALQLERDFQKRAEEAANQQDDDEESNDLDAESIQRVQGLLRTTTAQDRNNLSTEQQNSNLSRSNISNQSVRGNNVVLQSLGGSMHSTSVIGHGIAGIQPCPQNVCLNPIDNSSSHLSQHLQHEPTMQLQNIAGQQVPAAPSLIHLATPQKSSSVGVLQPTEDKDMQRSRREDEIKQKQIEFDESSKKKEEESKHQQIQQMYHQQSHLQQPQAQLKNQQALHANMLRLENLVINGTTVCGK